MSIFTDNVDFYPTPKEVIEKMVEPYVQNISRETYILEPSAGNGNIVDYLSNLRCYKWDYIKPNIHCIEKDLNMQSILRDKGYKLVGSDFLTHDNSQAYDLIIMNPPFSSGEHHLLKAWSVLDDGDICCLLNAETIRNPYTKVRETLINIISTYGSVEYLGNCFSDAERRTDVDVALVRLHKEETESKFKIDFDLKFNREDIEFNEDDLNQTTSVAVNDKLGAYIRAYNKSKEAFLSFAKSYEVLKQYTETYAGQYFYFDSTIKEVMKENSIKGRYNEFDATMRSIAWRKIISIMGLDKFMTRKIASNFDDFIREQSNVSLTKENIFILLNMLATNSSDIMKQCCVDVFDEFTKHYKENRMIVEGWKTNSSWKVNRKVILPDIIRPYYSFKTNFSVDYRSIIQDIDKVMCYISRKSYDELVKEEKDLASAINKVRIGDSSKKYSEFFEFRCYKKGTLHLYFKDEKLWDIFNQVACENKTWIGDGK